VASLLDDVNTLILKGVGDSSRLEHIKESIENNKPLYDSDKNYVNDLIQKYLLSNIQKDKDIKNSTTQNTCVKCSANLELNSNFCSKCGFSVNSMSEEKNSNTNSKDRKKQSKNNFPSGIPREVIEREESVVNAIAVSIIGIIALLGGIAITLWSLSMPMIIAGQYMILGLFVMVIGGLIMYGGKRLIKKKKSHFVCGYCGFIAESERELYNHSLLCEKKKSEDSTLQNKQSGESTCMQCRSQVVNDSNFCANCGTSTYSDVESHSTDNLSSSMPYSNRESNSWFWYLISTLFGIIGGFVGFFVTRKKSPKTARNCLIIGFISFVIGIIFISLIS
jgi:hypothetical protein